MSGLLAQMEASGLATWVRESPSIWAYPTILTLHSIGLGIVVGASMVIDLRLIGRARSLEMVDLSTLFPVIWWAFAVNALTGVLLFISDATRKGVQPIFFVKLGCIALALVVTLRTRSMLAGIETASAAASQKVLAVVSIVLWLAAIAAGRLMAYL
jgi:hypothetical protein